MHSILGINGNTGSVVAETLLAGGHAIRAIVRSPDKGERWRARGAEVAVADLDDTAALTRALAGSTGAYVLVPPRGDAADPRAHNRGVIASLAAAVAAAKVPHVVLLSSIGAQHAAGTGPIASLHEAERALAATGAALTAVRAGYFAENWGGSLGFVTQGFVPSFLPADLAVPTVATADIGRTAAAALVEGGRGRQVIELSGPRDVTAREVVAAVARIVGRDLRIEEAPLDAVVPTFTGFGMSPAVAALYREMYAGIAAGHVAWEGGAARAVRGSTTVDQVLQKLVARQGA
jgi:uncharacterized protein YbjT (DUF2867 family)